MFKCLLVSLFAIMAMAQADGDRVVAHVKEREIKMADVQTEEILALRRQLYEKLETAIAEKAADILENHPSDGDPDHMLKHFRHSVASGEVKLLIDVPPPLLKKVSVGDAYMFGNPEAEVVILAFFDASCPFCKEVMPTLERLSRKYRKSLGIAQRHLPLESHVGAYQAAMAMECAREQGKFEIMRTALLTLQDQQSKEDILRYASQANIADLDSFKECLEQARHKARIDEDLAIANELGLDGTPGFVIGRFDKSSGMLTGEVVDGALEYAEFVTLVDRYLPAAPKPSE